MLNNKLKDKLISIFDRPEIFPWPWTMADEIITEDIKKITNGKKFSLIIEEFKDGHIYHHINEDEANTVGLELIEKIKKDKIFYKNILKSVYQLSKSLNSFSNKINKEDFASYSNSELITLLKEYVAKIKDLRLYGWAPPLVDGLTTPFLSNLCIESLHNDLPLSSEKDIKRMYSVLINPDKFGQVQQSEIDKYTIVKKIGKKVFEKFKQAGNTNIAFNLLSPTFRKLVKDYVYKYSWITYNYEGPSLTLDSFYKELCTLSYLEATNQLIHILNNSKESRSEKKRLLEVNKISPYTVYLLRVATEFLLLKEYRKSVYQYSYVAMDKPLEEIAKRINTTLKSLKFLNIDEIEDVLQNGKMKRFLSRQSYCVVVVENGKSKFYDKRQGTKIVNFYFKKNKVEVKGNFSGQVAYPGEVKGHAKIIMTPNDLAKMNIGDILLSSSTNPDLLPAMKKAGAIVTDMGGITCHAAIVSRELKIPCVVGTRDITKYIKDGDILHVDANKGIINKISENENK